MAGGVSVESFMESSVRRQTRSHGVNYVMTLWRTNEGSEPARLMLVCWRAEVDVCGILDWSVSRNASPSAAGMETDLQPEL